MAVSMSATTSSLVTCKAKAADSGERKGRTNRLKDQGRRGLLLSAAVSVAQVTDSRTELLKSI